MDAFGMAANANNYRNQIELFGATKYKQIIREIAE